jgi:phosphoglucomutase
MPDRRDQGVRGTGWFAARPSGTENIYKNTRRASAGEALQQIPGEAQKTVDRALGGP